MHIKSIIKNIILPLILILTSSGIIGAQGVPKDFINPPREFSIMPFWFLNDTLNDNEIIRQIADFEAHGVYGFVIHPQIRLPYDIEWLSPNMIHDMNVAINEAERRNMYVVLYDEGADQLKEESPMVGDILNPDAVISFIGLVYDRYLKEFGKYFGTTILGIFTDEPSPLRLNSSPGVVPGNASLLKQINKILGYNITPFLADLWYNDLPDSRKHRTDYYRAINTCLEENYYKRLGTWCANQGVSLFGHPAGSMDIGAERFFQVPGQKLLWRNVEPGTNALEGEHSTVAKCASSSMVHSGLRRNSSEIYWANDYNPEYEEMEWLVNWCFVRGQNLIFPYIFNYSINGPRLNESTINLRPNTSGWKDYNSFPDACSKLCWLNTDSRHICDLAILCEATWLSDKAAKICFQHQRDFNYLEIRHLLENAKIDSKGVHIAGMNYGALILDSLSYMPSKAKRLLKKLARNGRLIINENSGIASMFPGAKIYKIDEDLISEIDKILSPDFFLTTSSHNIRYRHVVKGNDHFYIIFNEEATDVTSKIEIPVIGNRQFLDLHTSELININKDEIVHFKPHELKILLVNNYFKLPPM